MSALAFAALALLLTGPVPAVLARASWPLRAPRAAVVLWQAVAGAAVLSAFSAGLAIAALLFVPGAGRPTALGVADRLGGMTWPMLVGIGLVVGLTLLVAARLLVAVVRVGVDTRRRRSRHRQMVDLVGDHGDAGHHRSGHRVGHLVAAPLAGQSADVRVLRVREPLAYCLPGRRHRVVLSEGTLDALDGPELAAILSHERAHLRARHDLVLEAFVAVHTAFPRFVRSGSALDAVRLLVELLADDAAVRAAGPGPLARALVACAASRTPAGALAAGGPTTVIRVRRLSGRNSPLLSLTAYLAAAALLVVPTVAVAIPWLTELHRLFLG